MCTFMIIMSRMVTYTKNMQSSIFISGKIVTKKQGYKRRALPISWSVSSSVSLQMSPFSLSDKSEKFQRIKKHSLPL